MSLVCEKCLENEQGLNCFVASVSDGCLSDNCDYCGTAEPGIKKVKLEKLVNHIIDCLKDFYKIKKSKSDKYKTLSNFVEEYLPFDDEKLIQDLKVLLKKNIGEPYLIEKKTNTWDDFSDYTKKDTRFFFSSKAQILKEAMDMIKNNKLIRKIRPSDNERMYRARAFTEGNRILYDLRRMGPPEPEDTINISNRMSPPGVPVFYASFEKETALSEISQRGREGLAYISEFCFLKDIIVIDLTLAHNILLPSFFDRNKIEREKRSDLIFIQQLSAQLSEPIDKDGREHTDYVPTQILAEYIKRENIHGVIYESSRNPETGKNIALFFSQKNICEDEQDSNNLDIHLKFIKDKKTYNLPYLSTSNSDPFPPRG